MSLSVCFFEYQETSSSLWRNLGPASPAPFKALILLLVALGLDQLLRLQCRLLRLLLLLLLLLRWLLSRLELRLSSLPSAYSRCRLSTLLLPSPGLEPEKWYPRRHHDQLRELHRLRRCRCRWWCRLRRSRRVTSEPVLLLSRLELVDTSAGGTAWTSWFDPWPTSASPASCEPLRSLEDLSGRSWCRDVCWWCLIQIWNNTNDSMRNTEDIL